MRSPLMSARRRVGLTRATLTAMSTAMLTTASSGASARADDITNCTPVSAQCATQAPGAVLPSPPVTAGDPTDAVPVDPSDPTSLVGAATTDPTSDAGLGVQGGTSITPYLPQPNPGVYTITAGTNGTATPVSVGGGNCLGSSSVPQYTPEYGLYGGVVATETLACTGLNHSIEVDLDLQAERPGNGAYVTTTKTEGTYKPGQRTLSLQVVQICGGHGSDSHILTRWRSLANLIDPIAYVNKSYPSSSAVLRCTYYFA